MSAERHHPSGRSRLGFTFAVITMLLWGVLPFALKVTLVAMDAYTIVWYRFLASAALLAGILASRGALPALASLPANGWGLLSFAIAFLGANYVSFMLGLHHTNPANSQVLIQLAPVLLALGGLLVFEERFTRLQWSGFSVLLIGLAIFVRDQFDVSGVPVEEYARGSLFVLLAALSWAIYGLAQKQLLRWLSAQGAMVCIYTGCAAILSPLSTPGQLLRLDGLQLGMLVFCALNTLVAYGTFSEALAHWEASRVGAVLALTPVVTIASGAAIHALWPTVAAPVVSRVGLFGTALVVVGSLITVLGQPWSKGRRV